MHFSAGKLFAAIAFVVLLFVSAAVAQSGCPVMPAGYLCITQEAGDRAASNARELAATRDKVVVLEAALIEKDKNTEEIRAAAAKNEADLKAALHRTEVELATKTGQLIGSEAEKTRMLATIDVLLKYARPKKIGLINLF
jgi:nucleotide-binding universal stress UspA family protein